MEGSNVMNPGSKRHVRSSIFTIKVPSIIVCHFTDFNRLRQTIILTYSHCHATYIHSCHLHLHRVNITPMLHNNNNNNTYNFYRAFHRTQRRFTTHNLKNPKSYAIKITIKTSDSTYINTLITISIFSLIIPLIISFYMY